MRKKHKTIWLIDSRPIYIQGTLNGNGMKMIACIVLPTYNEADNISVIIPEIFKQQKRIESHELHVLVVDDNSPDDTRYVVEDLMPNFPNLHLITGPKQGLGDAYKRGMAWAIDNINPDLIFEMDADLQHDPDLIPLFIVMTGYDFSLVIGSRFAPGGSTPDFSFRRRLISRVGNWMIRFLGGIPELPTALPDIDVSEPT